MCHMLYATDPENNLLPQLVYEAVFYLIFFYISDHLYLHYY